MQYRLNIFLSVLILFFTSCSNLSESKVKSLLISTSTYPYVIVKNFGLKAGEDRYYNKNAVMKATELGVLSVSENYWNVDGKEYQLTNEATPFIKEKHRMGGVDVAIAVVEFNPNSKITFTEKDGLGEVTYEERIKQVTPFGQSLGYYNGQIIQRRASLFYKKEKKEWKIRDTRIDFNADGNTIFAYPSEFDNFPYK